MSIDTRSVAATIALLTAAGASQATISQATVVAPGGFIQAAGYISTSGGGLVPGGDMAASLGTGQEFNEFLFSGNSSASASAAASGTNISNSGTGTVGMGYFRAATSDSFPNSGQFTMGAVNGGWKETFTVSHPDHNGQAGFMLFNLHAGGTLHSTGFSGACGISTAVYKDNQELLVNAFLDRSESDAVGSDRQRCGWSVASDFSVEDRTIDATVTMAVPITFGQSFTLGVYAFARSSQRSQSGVGGISTGLLDFSGGGIEWDGISSVIAGGVSISGYTVTSGTGIDWVPPLGAACPADFNGDTFLNPDDLSDFITCFFLQIQFPGTCAGADYNGDAFVNPDDLSDFITAFFLGC